MDPNMDPAQAQKMAMHMMAAMFPLLAGFWLVKVALYIVPLWQSFKKAGLAPALSFLAAIPFVGRLVALYVLAFAEWRTAPSLTTYPSTYPPPPPYPPAGYPPQETTL